MLAIIIIAIFTGLTVVSLCAQIYIYILDTINEARQRNTRKEHLRSASAMLTYDKILCLTAACLRRYQLAALIPPRRAGPTKGKELAAYQLGQSDAAKRQYWIARNLQWENRIARRLPTRRASTLSISSPIRRLI